MPRLLARILSCSLVVALSAPSYAAAHPVAPSAPYVVSAEDTDGRVLPTFHHRGRTYLLGARGDRYNVRLENRTDRRVEAVLSVDGRDAVSGLRGDYVGERGYLIDPWSEVVVEGFRASYDEVAAFRFTDPSESYSARMGTPENVGVIGVAFFPERIAHARHVLPPREQTYGAYRGRDDARGRAVDDAVESDALRSSAAKGEGSSVREGAPRPRASRRSEPASAPLAEAKERSPQNLGTEYGESLESHVREVAFQRANARHPTELVTLYYDDHEGLRARGIPTYRLRPIVDRGPDPFPARRFAPPPQ